MKAATPRSLLVPVYSQEAWWNTVSQWAFDEVGVVLSDGEQESFHGEQIPCPMHGIMLSECACITEYLVEMHELTKVSIGSKDFALVDFETFQELFGSGNELTESETVSLLKKRMPLEGFQ
jgi:hypothetical protein